MTDDTTTTVSEESETEVLPVADQAPPSAGGAAEKPRLAKGIDLIGKYEGSGFKEAPYIARRADGQVVQLAPLLYLIAEGADGVRTNEEIAAAVSEAIKRGVSADNVRQLVDERLRPLGVIAPADGSEPELQKIDPLLALKLRAALVPESVVNAITRLSNPLFSPPVIVVVLAGLAAMDVWLFFSHGVAQSLREVLYSPALLMMMLGLVILSAAFHECGHATACAYGGARPGVMGAGLYIVWPAFYTDVTDAYRLNKRGRLRTDLGGVYFNVVFILATAGAYFATGFEPLLIFIPLMHMEIVHQFLPFIRLDGYYIVSDMTGVPDMFARIKPTLQSLLPWKASDDRVTELKPWVRLVVTAYVLTVIPALVFMFGMMLINAPRLFATGWDSFWAQEHRVEHSISAGAWALVAVGILQLAILVLPTLGIGVTFGRMGSRFGRGAWRRTEGRPAGRMLLVAGAAAAVALAGYVWWPNGDYRPIQPGERGTIQGAVRQFTAIPSGRPALTRVREQQLGGAPSKSSKRRSPKPATGTHTGTAQTPTTSGSTSTTPAGTTTSPASTSTEPTATATEPTTTTETGTTPSTTPTPTTETTTTETTTTTSTETTPTTTTQTTTTETVTTP